MAKFCGVIGYGLSVNTAPGIWTPQIQERSYVGDILKNYRKWTDGMSTNDDLILANRISIVADEFANSNLGAIRYVVWRGVCWKVVSIDIESPRLILTLGGVYNGERPN